MLSISHVSPFSQLPRMHKTCTRWWMIAWIFSFQIWPMCLGWRATVHRCLFDFVWLPNTSPKFRWSNPFRIRMSLHFFCFHDLLWPEWWFCIRSWMRARRRSKSLTRWVWNWSKASNSEHTQGIAGHTTDCIKYWEAKRRILRYHSEPTFDSVHIVAPYAAQRCSLPKKSAESESSPGITWVVSKMLLSMSKNSMEARFHHLNRWMTIICPSHGLGGKIITIASRLTSDRSRFQDRILQTWCSYRSWFDSIW